MAASLDLSEGDQCPETIDGDDCERTLIERHHERDPQLDTQPEGPVRELVCPVHGVVESV